MKHTFRAGIAAIVLIVCAIAPVASQAQSTSDTVGPGARWVGQWQGQLEGVPGVVLTLSDDLGELSGTIVFTAMRNGSIAGHATHAVMHPHPSGNVLSFQVKRPPGNKTEVLDMELELADSGGAVLRCTKCGSAPIAVGRTP